MSPNKRELFAVGHACCLCKANISNGYIAYDACINATVFFLDPHGILDLQRQAYGWLCFLAVIPQPLVRTPVIAFLPPPSIYDAAVSPCYASHRARFCAFFREPWRRHHSFLLAYQQSQSHLCGELRICYVL